MPRSSPYGARLGRENLPSSLPVYRTKNGGALCLGPQSHSSTRHLQSQIDSPHSPLVNSKLGRRLWLAGHGLPTPGLNDGLCWDEKAKSPCSAAGKIRESTVFWDGCSKTSEVANNLQDQKSGQRDGEGIKITSASPQQHKPSLFLLPIPWVFWK